MAKPTQEQIEFLNSLKSWSSSRELREEINIKTLEKYRLFIQDCRSKEVASDVLSIIEEEYISEQTASNDKHPLANRVLNSIMWTIEQCYEDTIWGSSLFKSINEPMKAKESLITDALKSNSLSLDSFETKAENRLLYTKILNLITILDKWICDIKHRHDIPNWKIVPMQNKYEQYKEQVEKHKHFCSVCVLSQYVDKPEEAKQFISEIFTTRQEIFYTSLEKWAKEIPNEDCSWWISSFLEKGRELRIKRITVLRMIDSEDKAKAFLMSKYQEKLEWDKKKKEEREKKKEKYLSVFDKYSYRNSSFDGLLKDNEYDKLYTVCISANYFTPERIKPILAQEDGFDFNSDKISHFFVEHLTLAYTNQLYYCYISTYRKSHKTIVIYTKKGCEIILDYLKSFFDNEIINSTIGILKHTNSEGKSYTYLLTTRKELYNQEPLIRYKNNPHLRGANKLSDNCLLEQALAWKLLNGKSNTIDLSPGNDYSSTAKDLVNEHVERDYDNMSFFEKHCFGYILSGRYKCPFDEVQSPIELRKNYIARIYNLWNCITNQYDSHVFEDQNFEIAKIEYQYGDSYFKKLVDAVGSEIARNNYRDIWFESCRGKNLVYLRVLLFLNWVYVSNSRNKVKKITACWLYYIVFDAIQNSYSRDLLFWEALMANVLIENETIFNTLFQKIDSSTNGNITSTLVMFYTKGKNDLSRGMSFEQKDYLSHNLRKSTLIKYYIANHKIQNLSTDFVKEITSKLFVRLKDVIESNDYSNDKLIEDLVDLPSLPIPSNFYYNGGSSSSKPYYNGDYTGSFAHDVMGYTNRDIDTIFDGDPDAYWNID